MRTAREVHKRIHEISRNYLSGTPPIHIDGLIEGSDISEDTLRGHLLELARQGMISFYESTNDVIKLTQQGLEEVIE
jgi:predicted transcriptional regulator